MGRKGKIVAIIGAVTGIVCVLFSLIIPQLFAWYCVRQESLGDTANLYLTGLGTFILDDYANPHETIGLVLIGGIMILVGAGLCIGGVAKEMRPLGIIGGVLMILGPIMLIFDLIGQVSDFAQNIHYLADTYGGNVFRNFFKPSPDTTIIIGIYYGYPIVYAGGILGLIGGATV